MSSKKSSKPFLLLSTVHSPNEAKKIAKVLIQKKLSACVNIVPNVSSLFTWKGKVDRARESLLVIKTDQKKLSQVERTIRKYHTYEVPEIIGWPIAWGHQPYLDWISASLRGVPKGRRGNPCLAGRQV